ncbi:MAG: hypothetical protein F6J98_00170 [Moorea sp. SIO4G2]|nr:MULTISPECIES: hypothetical protein [unclassified Moorena]NEO12308.1 hypothetical protein [Moorena sp. SIO3E8]NEO58918.1 hypothetical protein [Moorena sp. SIO4G2]NEP98952.1 hypothetical protein [Moorena sp. SIO3F7]
MVCSCNYHYEYIFDKIIFRDPKLYFSMGKTLKNLAMLRYPVWASTKEQ